MVADRCDGVGGMKEDEEAVDYHGKLLLLPIPSTRRAYFWRARRLSAYRPAHHRPCFPVRQPRLWPSSSSLSSSSITTHHHVFRSSCCRE